MKKSTLALLTALSLGYVGTVLADSEMFRPLEPYIENTAPVQLYELPNWNQINREQYIIIRRVDPSSFQRQEYSHRHCGNAYMNCRYPDQDYPRHNGNPYHLPRR